MFDKITRLKISFGVALIVFIIFFGILLVYENYSLKENLTVSALVSGFALVSVIALLSPKQHSAQDKYVQNEPEDSQEDEEEEFDDNEEDDEQEDEDYAPTQSRQPPDNTDLDSFRRAQKRNAQDANAWRNRVLKRLKKRR